MTIEVLLPFYGDPAHLKEAVDSVLAQDDPDWRLTVVDDAYPDPDAAAWVGSIPDERVRLLRNETNLGVSGSFQRCLDLATAEWVVFMGGDDRMRPHFIARMRAGIAAHPHVAYLQPGVQVIDDLGRPSRPLADRLKAHYRGRLGVVTPTVVDSLPLLESLLRGNWMYFPATCWRREAIARHGFEPRYEIVLDWWLQLRLLHDGERALLDPEVTFEYRRHATQASTTAALDASRFHEEKSLVLQLRDVAERRGWRRARRIATLHLSSRLHALTTLASQLRAGRVAGTPVLVRHAFTNRRPPGQWPAFDALEKPTRHE